MSFFLCKEGENMADNPFSTTRKSLTNAQNYANNNGYNGGVGTAIEEMKKGIGISPNDGYGNYVTNPSNSSGNTGNGGGSSKSATTSATYGIGDYLSSLYAQRQAAAQAAYDRANGLLNDAYNSAKGNYQNIYNRGVDTLDNSYNNSLGKVNQNAEKSMQEAYVNKMLSMKNLSQQLAARGLSGGASESTVAGLLNNYGNARNNIQNTWDTNRGDLEQNYNTNLSDLYNTYQGQLAALDQSKAAQQAQLLQNLNNQIATAQDDYFGYLMKNPQLLQQSVKTTTQNAQSYAPTDYAVTNAVNPVNTTQGNDVGQLAQGAKYQQSLLDYLDKLGGNTSAQAQYLIRNGYNNQQIADILNNYLK